MGQAVRMLGLDGKYTQILVDGFTGPRGLNVVQGLSFVPGPWIDAIANFKGNGVCNKWIRKHYGAD